VGRLEGKVALITGAARGTGAATARLFAREGARLLLGDVRDDLGREVAKQIGGAAHYRHLDVRSEADWRDAVGEAVARHGGLDVLVNNAAILLIRALAETSGDDLLRLVEVNQLGPYLGMRAVIEPMRARGGGSIVNVSSSDGIKGMNGVSAYASTKWALRGITRSAAMELGRHRIRVNCVCPEAGNMEMSLPFLPAGIDAEAAQGASADKILAAPEGYTMADRMLDVARAILFLASDESRTTTGADFVIDGGITAGYIQPGIAGAEAP
jgi:3alpha(or 20beta)-hydroxysteroid dehydrogenase